MAYKNRWKLRLDQGNYSYKEINHLVVNSRGSLDLKNRLRIRKSRMIKAQRLRLRKWINYQWYTHHVVSIIVFISAEYLVIGILFLVLLNRKRRNAVKFWIYTHYNSLKLFLLTDQQFS